jgi:polyisoprenoid-binding protein YceI
MNPTQTEIDNLSIAELAQHGASTLAALANDLEAASTALEARKAKLHAAMVRRYGDGLQRAMVEAGKDTGTFNLNDPSSNELLVKINITKRVEWDQDKLTAILDAMPLDEARHYAKATFKVEEKKFLAAPPAIQGAFAPARSVKPGKPSFTFCQQEA